MQNITVALLRAGILPVNASTVALSEAGVKAPAALGTILGNMAFYGFAPTSDALQVLARMPEAALTAFWQEMDSAMAELTGHSREMTEVLVYKNFPAEVLEMSRAQYWIGQIFMYAGAPKENFSQDAAVRDPLEEKLSLKMLRPTSQSSHADLLEELKGAASTWNDARFEDATALFDYLGATHVNFAEFPAKANAAILVNRLLSEGKDATFTLTTPVDALRIISLISGGDARLSKSFKVVSLKRALRRILVGQLDAMGADVLAEAFAGRRSLWKQVLMRLHPGDYAAPALNAAYDLLYRGEATGIEAQISEGIGSQNPAVFGLAAAHPGIFARRLRHMHKAFGRTAFTAFLPVLPQLSILQMARLERVFATLKDRKARLYTPKGQFSKAKVIQAGAVEIPDVDIDFLCSALKEAIAERINAQYPEGFCIEADVDQIKLAMNGQELSPYGRGTRFAIPEGVNFIRSMSYWNVGSDRYNSWFDNGWNFFGPEWTPIGTTCWDAERFGPKGSEAGIFSGDPTSAQTEGRGTQAIDIYLDRLEEQGVRYAVWSTLCYSGIPFCDAIDVFACLQWGIDAQAGEVFEPSRAQMAFPIKSDALTNVTAMIDLETRELIYLDAALPISTQTAQRNQERLSALLPALLEVIAAQPSIADVFSGTLKGKTPVMRSDAKQPVIGSAYVFEPQHPDSKIDPFNLDDLLNHRA